MARLGADPHAGALRSQRAAALPVRAVHEGVQGHRALPARPGRHVADALRGPGAGARAMAVVTRDRSSRWRPEERRAGRWIAAFALALYVFTAGGSMATTDAVVTFDVARNLVEHGSVATSGNLLGL